MTGEEAIGAARVAVAVPVALLVASLCACSATTAPPPGETASGAAVAPMALAQRTSALPDGFPPQVPVPAGKVIGAAAAEAKSGRGVWTYTVDVPSSVHDVASWYTQGLTALNWEGAAGSGTSAGWDLDFTKGDGGRIHVHITPRGGSGSRAEASVSIGVPVTPAQ